MVSILQAKQKLCKKFVKGVDNLNPLWYNVHVIKREESIP